TGLTVALIATLTITTRDLAERFAAAGSWRPRLATAFGIAGAGAILLLGILLLGAGLVGTALAG
ncbi:hypothetical protein J8J27_30475, partial [Mycobacterium tuberculosis]|nr:hypothetical protein [Mycobacterium tuberculosis]